MAGRFPNRTDFDIPIDIIHSHEWIVDEFIDGPTGSTYRDIDWYDNATLNAGGDFTLSVGSSGMDLLFGIVDLNAGAFINAYICPGGEEMIQTETLPAGNYAYLCAPAEWNVSWTCSSGLVDYWAQLD